MRGIERARVNARSALEKKKSKSALDTRSGRLPLELALYARAIYADELLVESFSYRLEAPFLAH